MWRRMPLILNECGKVRVDRVERSGRFGEPVINAVGGHRSIAEIEVRDIGTAWIHSGRKPAPVNTEFEVMIASQCAKCVDNSPLPLRTDFPSL